MRQERGQASVKWYNIHGKIVSVSSVIHKTEE